MRNSLQGMGDTKTPLVSSLIEPVGKTVIAYTLVSGNTTINVHSLIRSSVHNTIMRRDILILVQK